MQNDSVNETKMNRFDKIKYTGSSTMYLNTLPRPTGL